MNEKYVVIIDDDPMSTFVTRSIFNRCYSNLKIYTFDNASAGIDHIVSKIDASQLPELIILDINMPELNGWETLEKLEKKCEGLSYLILTSSIHPRDRAKADSYKNVKKFLNKPLSRKDVEMLSLD